MEPQRQMAPLITIIALLVVISAQQVPAQHLTGPQWQEQKLLSDLQQDLSYMRDSVLDFWFCHGLDKEFGGVHGTLLLDGSLGTPTAKGLVQETRHAWAFSLLHEAGYAKVNKTGSLNLGSCISNTWPSSKDLAMSAGNFFRTHMRRPDGLYVWNVSRDGRTTIQDIPVIYGQWHVIIALTKIAKVFNDPAALQLALQNFRAVDSRWHNRSTGGFNEYANNTFPPDIDAPGVKPLVPWRWANTTGPIPRSLNVMMHGTEALLALHQVSRDPTVLARLQDYVHILCTRLGKFDGVIFEEYNIKGGVNATSSWPPTPEAVINFGHNLETTWLLLDTLDYLQSIKAISSASAAQCRNSTLSMGQAAVRLGYDNKHGGVNESAMVVAGHIQPNSTVKVWWIQAEAMLALWKLYKHTGNVSYLQKLVQTADFVRRYVFDQKYGECFWQVEPNGTFVPTKDLDKGAKGDRWKASYHSTRVWLYLNKWMGAAKG